ncbi:putative dehydrogenase, partial [Arthrobacter sp. UYNi723]
CPAETLRRGISMPGPLSPKPTPTSANNATSNRWPQGHIIGWEHTFTHQIRDFLVAIDAGAAPSPSFEEGLQVQRILAAVEKSANNKGTLTAVEHKSYATAEEA